MGSMTAAHPGQPPARRRLALGAGALALAALLLGSGLRPAQAKLWDGGERKCELTIPDDPAPWEWLPHDSAWAKYDIQVGAERRLKELRDGSPAHGQGGQLHLAVKEAPEGTTLDGLAADAKLREFFTARFTKVTEKLQVEDGTLNADIPAKILRMAGRAMDLGGKEAACHGAMLVALAHGRIYLLRMYAWPTADDLEGVKDDLDWIEINGLTILDAEHATAPEEGSAPPPDPADDEPEEAGVEEQLEFEDHNLVLVKHAKLTRVELDRDEGRQDVLFKFSANDVKGSYDVMLYAFPVVGNQQRANLPQQVGLSYYQEFLESHGQGDIYTFPWPKKPATTREKTFLTLPDLSEAAREVISDADRKKPDPEASLSDLKKLGVYEQPKLKNVGSDFTASGPVHRAVLGGNLPNVGEHITLKYGWYSNTHDFVLYISFAREGYMKYGEAVRATIESIRLPKKWDRRWK